jgi:GT2 family glycosyltransferase
MVQSFEMNNMDLDYIYEPRRGKCHANNAGLKLAQGEIILFLDDDVRPPKNWIEGLSAPILAGKASAVAGGIKLAPHLVRRWMTKLQKSLLASTEHQDLENPDLVGASCCIARDVLASVPAFDTELGPGALGLYDDSLFSFQIKQAGFRIAHAFDIVSEHHFDENRLLRNSWLRHAKMKGQSLAYLRYHWLHKEMKNSTKRLIESQLSLIKNRIKQRGDRKKSEGIPDWEITLVSHTHLYKQFLKEQKRPRNYEKHGLVKLGCFSPS